MQGPIPNFLDLSMGTCPGQYGNILASFSDIYNHPVIFNFHMIIHLLALIPWISPSFSLLAIVVNAYLRSRV